MNQETQERLAELRDEQEVLQGRIDEDRRALRQVRQEIAEIICPFKVDDLVRSKREGWLAHVERIIPTSKWGGTNWEIHVRRIKKDGTPYANSLTDARWRGWEKLETPLECTGNPVSAD